MNDGDRLRLATAGAVCGIVATGAYFAKTLLPLPDPVSTLCWLSLGPLVVAGVPGLTAYLQREHRRPATEVAKCFGILAGAFHLVMTVVQSTNLTYMRQAIQSAQTAELKASLRSILDGVFTVQLGLGFCWDAFIALTTLLFGVALLHERVLGRVLGVFGLLVGGLFLTFKVYTFPVPPAEAGLFDLGPAVGVWFLFMCVFVLANRNQIAIP